jgi:orotate phosphoribosyltransferase
MSPLEIAGTRAAEYVSAMRALRSAKVALLERMALFDREFNGHERVTRQHPLYEQLELFCYDQYVARDEARREAKNARKRMETACRRIS